MHLANMQETIEIPQGAAVTVSGTTVHVKGPKGEQSRAIGSKNVQFTVQGNEVVVSAKNATKNDKRILQTNAAHLRNMLKGATQGHVYKLKICSGHFPMSVTLKGDLFEVKNFI